MSTAQCSLRERKRVHDDDDDDTIFLETSQKSTQKHCSEWRILDFTLKNAIANFKLDISPKFNLYGPF